MPDTHYIKLDHYLTRVKENKVRAEIQVDASSELVESPELTSLRVHSYSTGEPITGEAVLDLAGLKALRDALNARIGELERTPGRDSLDDVGDVELRQRIRGAIGDLTFAAPQSADFIEGQVARAKARLAGED